MYVRAAHWPPILCTTGAGISMGLSWPLLALLLEREGASGVVIGTNASAQTGAALVAASLAGTIIRRLGIRRTSSACIAVMALCFIALPLVGPGDAWLPLRFALGAAAFTLFTATQTWIHALCREEQRGQVIGMFGFVWSVGFAGGPILISVLGIEGWAPFLAGTACLAASAVPIAFGRVPSEGAGELQRRSSFLQLICAAPGPMLAFFSLGFVDASNDSFLPLYGMHLGLSERQSLWLLTTLLVAITIAHLPAGWISDRMSRPMLLGLSAGLGGAIAATLPSLRGQEWLLAPAVAGLGLMIGSLWTVAVVMIGQKFRGADLVHATACEAALYGCGAVVGPILVGGSQQTLGSGSFPWLIAGACLSVLAFAALPSLGARLRKRARLTSHAR